MERLVVFGLFLLQTMRMGEHIPCSSASPLKSNHYDLKPNHLKMNHKLAKANGSTSKINSYRRRRVMKSSKDKKSGKSVRTAAPTISSMPSLAPSPSPSLTPTVSTRPSTVPSLSPSFKPSSSPTSVPSFSPSVSSQPSLNPTSQPSAMPSSSPSSNPSSSPSLSPSSKPTVSNAPSSIPTVMPSDFPSVNTIVGTKFVDGGIQQGCTVPSNMDDSNFAEESVKRVPISFVYTIRFKTSANENIVQSDIEKDFQNFVFNNYINCEVDNSDRRRLVERASTSFPNLQDYQREVPRLDQQVMERPIGASSAPVDEMASDIVCADNTNEQGETCKVMDGQFSLIFADNVILSESEQELFVLTAIKDAIKSGLLIPTNKDTIALEYFGKRGGGFLSQAGIVSSGMEMDTPVRGEKSGVSLMGGVLIGASFVVVALALFAGYHRKKYSHFLKVNQGALTGLRRCNSSMKTNYDLCEVRMDSFDDDSALFDYDQQQQQQQQPKVRSIGTSSSMTQEAQARELYNHGHSKAERRDISSSSSPSATNSVLPPFPLTLPNKAKRNSNSSSDVRPSSNEQQYEQMTMERHYSRYTQNVHRCNSALCLECQADVSSSSSITTRSPGGTHKQVRFIPIRISSFSSSSSSDHKSQQQQQQQQQDLYSWYDGSDVDFSIQSIVEDSNQRNYATPDTVHL